MTATAPLDASWHARAEISGLCSSLARFLTHQRQRGRTPAADTLHGLVIEDGEAEGLLATLAADWQSLGPSSNQPSSIQSDTPPKMVNLVLAAAAQGANLPLRQAINAFELGPAEYSAVLLALAAELDPRFGRLFAYLNDHVAHTRPTIGLATAVASIEHGGTPFSPLGFPDHPVARDGLVEVYGDGPIPGRSLSLSLEVAHRLTSASELEPSTPGVVFQPPEVGALDRLLLPEATRARLHVWVDETRRKRSQPSALVLSGHPGSGRATVARATTSAAGLGLISVEVKSDELDEMLRIGRRDARWYDSALLVEVVDSPTDFRAVWRSAGTARRPVLLSIPTTAIDEAFRHAPGSVSVIRLEDPGSALRAQLWQRLLPPGTEIDEGSAQALATRFNYNAGRIAHTVRRAASELTLRPPGKRRLTADTLHRAAREVGRAEMGPLAQRLPLPYEPHDLVVPQKVGDELQLAIAWVREQEQVLAVWGFEERLPFGRGLSALFSGPSGTGKTMSAQVLARQLDLELYRVDLSRVMSKYIGETEKNLAQLFDESRRSGAMLFFDEADALFGKRSEVKDAHDRYANVEIGYLLQRMEEHDGIVVLATNRRQDMDEAFTRRFDIMVDFPMPDEGDRVRIWKGMFPSAVEVEDDLDVETLARRFELSGGEIRNTVVAAAYLAADQGLPIALDHLRHALRRELIKSGRVVDEAELRSLGPQRRHRGESR